MEHNKATKIHIAGMIGLITLTFVIMCSGAAYSQINQDVKRMDQGKTDIRILSEGIDFEGKTPGHEEERTDHIPIVLWDKTAPQAVLSLYIKTQYADAAETIRIARHSPEGRQKSLSDRLSGALDAYPIVYKVKVGEMMDKEKWRAKSLVKTESILTADVNGDGIEELIIPKTHGDIDVYDTAKRLFQSRPCEDYLPPALYDLTHIGAHVASLENRDVVFLTFNRRVAGGLSSLSEKDRQKARQEDIAGIFRIDQTGIHRIVPLGVSWILSKVWAVGAINYPGSKQIDEIVILHEMEGAGEDDTYLTRLKPDGQVIDKPRKFYSSYSEYGDTTFIFVPQSRQIIMEGAEGYYFITPEKPVNWARRVNLPDDYAGILRHDKGLVVLVRDKMNLYAFDEEERFYTRDAGGKLQRAASKKPFYTFQPESERHTLEGIYVSKQAVDHPQYLVAQYRETKTAKARPWHEYLAAAQRYMKDDLRESRLAELKASAYDYDEIRQERAEIEYWQKNQKDKKLTTLDDVKKFFPEYYPVLKAKFEEEYHRLIFSKLLKVPREDNMHEFKDPQGCLKWWEAEKVTDDRETVYTFISNFKETKKISLTDYHRGKAPFEASNLRLPQTTFRNYGNALTIVTLSRIKSDLDANGPIWLMIHQEGGRN